MIKSEKEQHIRDVLLRLSGYFHEHLILAGIVDQKAKLLDYQIGTVTEPQMAHVRQNDLNVKVSLIFALAKQFEGFTGSLSHSVLTYDDYEMIIMDISEGAILFVICTSGAATDIVDSLTRLTEDAPLMEESNKWMTAGHNPDYVDGEWSGR